MLCITAESDEQRIHDSMIFTSGRWVTALARKSRCCRFVSWPMRAGSSLTALCDNDSLCKLVMSPTASDKLVSLQEARLVYLAAAIGLLPTGQDATCCG